MIAPSSAVNDLNALPLAFFRPPGFREVLPRPVHRTLYLNDGGVLLAWAFLALLVAAVFALQGLGRVWWLVPVILLASTIPHGMIVWLGDPSSIGRHALLVAVLLRLNLILLLLLVADAYLFARR
jgi:hypothetical protein